MRKDEMAIVDKVVELAVSQTLEEVRAEIPKLVCGQTEYRQDLVKVSDVLSCIDKHKSWKGWKNERQHDDSRV